MSAPLPATAALGFRGELAQDFGLEAADHRLAPAVHHPAAGEIRIRHIIAILGAHTDGQYVNSGLARLIDEVIEAAVVFLAIAEDDEGVVLLAGFLERLDGQPQRVTDVGAAAGRPVLIDLVDRLAHGLVIHRERGIHISTAREADDADAFVGHRLQQFVNRHLRAGEAVRFHIGDAHAAREVQRDEHVAAE
jgi:hypothetical protein